MQVNANTTPFNATTASTQSASKAAIWTGRVLSGLAALFLIFDGVTKLMRVQPVIDSSIELGLPVTLAPIIGAVSLVCLVIHLIPRTAVLGAVLLTGFLGGAIAIQARIGAAPFSMIFPVIMGALVWGGLFLRNAKVRRLFFQS